MAASERGSGTHQQPINLDYSRGSPPKLRRYLFRFIRWTGLIAIVAAAFALGRSSVNWDPWGAILGPQWDNPSGDRPPTISDQAARFGRIVDSWNAYIVHHDGYLPNDLYRVIYESGELMGYRELANYDACTTLPVRLNPDLPKNVKWPIFWEDRPDLGEIWICYADGTWSRIKAGQNDGGSWYQAMWAAGFPLWDTQFLKDERGWIRDHGDELIWDQTRRLYALKPKSATSPATRRAKP